MHLFALTVSDELATAVIVLAAGSILSLIGWNLSLSVRLAGAVSVIQEQVKDNTQNIAQAHRRLDSMERHRWRQATTPMEGHHP